MNRKSGGSRTTDASPIPRADVMQVLLASGLCGLFLGMACGWQIAIQSAQVVAGIVSYPPDNPFYLYHIQTWTLLHQIPALLMICGLSEQTVSILLSGLIGMASFQALALSTLAIGRNRLIACVAPLLCLAADACSDNSATYPIRVLSNQPWVTYGAAGASLTLLVWSLLGLRRDRSAAFLMGLAPAIHPAVGSWCLAVGLLALLWHRRAEEEGHDFPWAPFFTGCAGTCTSLAVHWRHTHGLPRVPRDISRPLVESFAATWDSHRVAFPIDEPIVLVALCTILLGGVWLIAFHRDLPLGSRLLLRTLMASAALGLALCAVTHLQAYLPLAIAMAMPGRFINIVGLAFPALVLGLLARYRCLPAVSVLLAGLMIHLPLRALSLEYSQFYVPPAGSVLIAAALVLLAVCRDLLPKGMNVSDAHHLLLRWIECLATASVALLGHYCWDADPKLSLLLWAGDAILVARLAVRETRDRSFDRDAQRSAATHSQPPNRPLLWRQRFLLPAPIFMACVFVAFWLLGPMMASGLMLAAAFLFLESSRLRLGAGLTSGFLILGSLVSQAFVSHATLPDWRNDPVFAHASQGRGLLLTASMLRAVQLQTRRGVLLEGPSLNQLPYVPDSGPAMNRILNAVYGEDLLTPRPFNWQPTGGLKRYCGRELWEAREADEWSDLARQFGFTDVVTYADWSLKLPVAARSDDLVLYHVPHRREQAVTTEPVVRTR